MPYILPPPPTTSKTLARMSPRMLLRIPLTDFLSQNTTPQLPTMMLLSPTGKMLSTASPEPSWAIRSKAVLATSLWNLYEDSAPSLMTSALPRIHHQGDMRNQPRGSESTISSTTTVAENEISIITIQLSQGIMVIRMLQCGLLFVAVGSASTGSSSEPSPPLIQGRNSNSANITSPTSSPPNRSGDMIRDRDLSAGSVQAMGSGAPSESGSVAGSMRSGSIMVARKQAGEVCKWLDTQLEGFSLGSYEGR